MNFFRTKKGKTFTLIVGSTIALSSMATVLVYKSFPSAEHSLSLSSNALAKPNLIPKDNLDFSHSNNSNSDSNLNEIPKTPEKEKTPSTPEIIKPIQPDVKPKEPSKPTTPKTETPKYDSKTITITINGVQVKARVKTQQDRVISQYDKDNNIANINPYQNQIVGDIEEVEVTEELRKKNLENGVNGLKDNKVHHHYLSNLFDNNTFENMTDEEVENFFKHREPWNWQSILDRYKRLLDSPNVGKFLKEEAKTRWENKADEVHKWGKSKQYAWLIKNLDYSKFTKTGQGVEEMLKKGYTIDPSNAYIDENGNINSYAFSPAPGYNKVTSRIKRDNLERRAFGYDSEYGRNPIDIEKGDYQGWTKTDVTNEFKNQGIGVDDGDGIKIYNYKKEKPSGEKDEFTEGRIVEIDASNDRGYNKALSVIQKIKEKPDLKVVGFRVLNMGESSTAQKFKDILTALPNELRQLELWFSARATNTSSLIALEDKHIKELSLYTKGNSLLDSWSFNPLSFRKTEWINTVDYNVNWNLREEKATRITFDTLAFDSIDYDANASDPYHRINLGLRMAYYARNNEPIFQGGFGPGLSPDHDEKGNSYPIGLNLTRIPQLRSLKGLKFSDEQKPQNGQRKIKRLTLFNNSDTFSISSDELNQAGFAENIAWNEPMSRAYLYFSNGSSTSKVKITGNTQLTSQGFANLQVLFKIADSLNKSKPILTDNDEIANALKNYGYNAQKSSGDDDLIFT